MRRSRRRTLALRVFQSEGRFILRREVLTHALRLWVLHFPPTVAGCVQSDEQICFAFGMFTPFSDLIPH